MADLDLTAAIEAGVDAVLADITGESARLMAAIYAQAAVRAAAPVIEQAVREHIAAEMTRLAAFWRKEYTEAPEGTMYETTSATKADTYEEARLVVGGDHG